jgi:hypothetical protein
MLRKPIAQRGRVHVDLLNAFQRLMARISDACEE